MLLTDAGLALVLVGLALFLLWRLVDLFKTRGPLGARDGRVGRSRRCRHETSIASFCSALCCFVTGCGARPPDVQPPVYDTGVDPDAWARVPAGEFLMGIHEAERPWWATTTRSWSRR